jgi:hypothetical protein
MQRALATRFAIAALSLVLLWRIVQVNAVLYEEDGRPRLPVVSGSSNLPPTGAAEREALATALRDNPAQVAALLGLAREYERGPDPSLAEPLYATALRLAPLDREVLYASAAFALRSGQREQAIALLAKLVDHYSEFRDRVFPVLAASLASGKDAAAWQALFAQDASWLGGFVVASCRRGTDPLLLAPIVAKRTARGRATQEESSCLVDRLRLANRWDEAYQVWLNSLPRERLADVGLVFNGAFEYMPANGGFDWIVDLGTERQTGHVVELVTGLGVQGKRALRVTYNGRRQSGVPIAQYLALAPGTYDLSGSGHPEGLRLGKGVQWTVRCVADGVPGKSLATSERFVGSSEWRPFSFEVVVPDKCAGQVLRLELAGADEGAAYLGGAVWFDNIALRRRAR